MKKYILDGLVIENLHINSNYGLLKIKLQSNVFPEISPGQFVQVEVTNSKNTFLRRPISVCQYFKDRGEIWLLIRKAGNGTENLLGSTVKQVINMILPLGSGFSNPIEISDKILLIGGGVGVAPLLYFGHSLKTAGFNPEFLIGAKSRNDLLLLDEFRKIGTVHISTDDGSVGEKGFAVQNSILKNTSFKFWYCCGPQIMMKGIAQLAHENNIGCEVSLENMMACGVGACLCCVEDTKDQGNVCVCKEGPVFNINRLKW